MKNVLWVEIFLVLRRHRTYTRNARIEYKIAVPESLATFKSHKIERYLPPVGGMTI